MPPLTPDFFRVFRHNGQDLTLLGAGDILCSNGAVDGPGAIAETNDGLSMVLGLLPVNFVEDNDVDGTIDMVELYKNIINRQQN